MLSCRCPSPLTVPVGPRALPSPWTCCVLGGSRARTPVTSVPSQRLKASLMIATIPPPPCTGRQWRSSHCGGGRAPHPGRDCQLWGCLRTGEWWGPGRRGWLSVTPRRGATGSTPRSPPSGTGLSQLWRRKGVLPTVQCCQVDILECGSIGVGGN